MLPSINKLNRWYAFGLHLALSAIIFIILLGVIVFWWYPGAFIDIGGKEGILLVAGVDIVLGPLLTLIVFNPLKKALKIDLAVVAFVQFTCLAAGVWFVHDERPIAQVLVDDYMQVLSRADFRQFNLDVATLEKIEGTYPKKIYLDLPDNADQIAAIKFTTEFSDLRPIAYRTDLYRSLTTTASHTLAWRLSQLSFNKEKGCWNILVNSSHFKGEGCIRLDDGLVLLF